jgi:hypothetical protein
MQSSMTAVEVAWVGRIAPDVALKVTAMWIELSLCSVILSGGHWQCVCCAATLLSGMHCCPSPEFSGFGVF